MKNKNPAGWSGISLLVVRLTQIVAVKKHDPLALSSPSEMQQMRTAYKVFKVEIYSCNRLCEGTQNSVISCYNFEQPQANTYR